MDSLITGLYGASRYFRTVALLCLGMWLLLDDHVLSSETLSVFNLFELTQTALGYLFLVLGIFDLAWFVVSLANADFSNQMSGVYKAFFSYDEPSLRVSIGETGHPSAWQEQVVVCPTSSSPRWRDVFISQMEKVDQMLDPKTKLYSSESNLKTHIVICLKFEKVSRASQIYRISGFGYIVDEANQRQGKFSKYVSFVKVDEYNFENSVCFRGLNDLVLFFIVGVKMLIRCEQHVSPREGDRNAVLPFFIHTPMRMSPRRYMNSNGPSIVYLEGSSPAEKVVNAHCRIFRV